MSSTNVKPDWWLARQNRNATQPDLDYFSVDLYNHAGRASTAPFERVTFLPSQCAGCLQRDAAGSNMMSARFAAPTTAPTPFERGRPVY
jgi:hypothetical protein